MNRIRYLSPRYEKVTAAYYETTDVRLKDSGLWLATFNRGELKKVMDGETEHDSLTVFREISNGLLYFPMKGDKPSERVQPFITDRYGRARQIRLPEADRTVTLNGLHLYDVKRVLTLDEDVDYWLKGWDGTGWQTLKKGTTVDSVTLNFGEVPDYKLFLVHADTRMGRMQRPFLIRNKGLEYY